MASLAQTLPVGNRDFGFHHGARRASERFALNADVQVTSPESAEGVVINASAGGLRVAIDRPFAPGDDLVVRVSTPARETVEHVRVVWARDISDGALLGLQFRRSEIRQRVG